MIDPDEIGKAARRLAAKMVADQKVDIMASVTGLDEPQLAFDLANATDRTGIVVVATGRAALYVMKFLTEHGTQGTPEVEKVARWSPVEREHAHRFLTWEEAREFADTQVKGWPAWRIETLHDSLGPAHLIALRPDGPWVGSK